jgi:hypothetical protein
MNTSRMIICEAVNDAVIGDLVRLLQDHVGEIPNLAGHSVLVEEGGRMVLLITEFRNREDCLLYHSSRAYRQLVARTQHLLIGSYVVKLFHNRTESQQISLSQ